MLVAALKKLITAYHLLISPWLGSRCRYVPTCSDYAIQALDQHGLSRGLWLAAKRISRCHPWGGEGHDPVPPKSSENTKTE